MISKVARTSVLTAVFIMVFLAAPDRLHSQDPPETDQERIERLERDVAELREAISDRDSLDVEEIRRQIDAITRELEELQLGRDVVVADTSRFGLGPAASKVYRTSEGVSIGGYGEMLYQNFAGTRQDGEPSGRKDQIDFLRAVVYFGYKFDGPFVFNSEIEVEHASTTQSGSVSVEFAYLDWFFKRSAGLRGGLLLAPLGFVNEMHEPTTFLGSTRPETERRIIPTTWRENGIGVFAETGGFSLRGYVMNSLDGGGFDAAGLRGGRQKGSKALAENFSFVGRADWTRTSGLLIGTSASLGNTGQGATLESDPGRDIEAFTVVWDVHAQLRRKGWDVRGLLALSWIDEAASLNELNGFTGDESVGERLFGWYLQAGYDVLRRADTQVQLLPYVRYERINTQDRVPTGFSADPSTDDTILTVGVQVLPLRNLVLKLDYQWWSDPANTGVNQFNVALGYIF